MNADRAAAEKAAARFKENLDIEFECGDKRLRVWASVGLAHSADGADSVFARADVKMYESKKRDKLRDGRNGPRLGLA
jgi:GGDEF domain-containing protein